MSPWARSSIHDERQFELQKMRRMASPNPCDRELLCGTAADRHKLANANGINIQAGQVAMVL